MHQAMSFPNRPQISRVRSSHSLRSQPVKITRCPDISGPSILSEVNLSSDRPIDPKPRKPVEVKRNAAKPSSSRIRMQGSGRPPATAALPDEPALLTDDFLEEMKAGLDEMGEKLKHVERELTKKKTPAASKLCLKPCKKSSPQPKKEKLVSRPSLAGYNPIDFTDLDFGIAAPASSDDSRHSNFAVNAANSAPVGLHRGATSEEPVEDVIAKIRNDIQKWRVAKGIPEPSADIVGVYPPASSNNCVDIVVREAAERETPCESNRSSDNATKIHSDSLSSDPPSHEESLKIYTSPTNNTQSSLCPEARPLGNLNNNTRKGEDTSSSTLSNSMPGILRQRGPRYPLDKYLPKGPKREERFIKTREPALLKDVNLFRKIESLLKESERIRVPTAQPNLEHRRIQQPCDFLVHNIPIETSISTEDLVAAELFKASYGSVKKPESSVKPSAQGAGDWVGNTDLPLLGRKQACEPGVGKLQDPCAQSSPEHCLEAANRPKPVEGKRQESALEQPNTASCIQDNAHMWLREPHSDNRSEQKIALLTMSESSDSIPSKSLQSKGNDIIKKSSPLKKVTMTNACINTDRVNTHVLKIKHSEPNVGDDFASSSKVKSFVVQELPRVNIRGRLVKQNCGFVSINPVRVTKESRNIAVLEINHNEDVLDEGDDRVCPEKPHLLQGVKPTNAGRPTQPEQIRSTPTNDGLHDLAPSCTEKIPQTTSGHRLAFGRGLIQQSIAPKTMQQPPHQICIERPNIFDTVAHFKEKLSSEINSGLEPIKLALNKMLSNLKEFCDIGLNGDACRNIPSASKSSPSVVRERVDRMDDILKEEIKTWGFGDQGHYNLLVKAIDDLTDEIRSSVKTFQRQRELKEQTQHFLEGSSCSPHPMNKTMLDANVTQPHDGQTVRIDKLFAIHSFLQESAVAYRAQSSNIVVDSVEETHAEFGQGDAPDAQGIHNETFTLDRSPPPVSTSNVCEVDIAGLQNVGAESDEEEIPNNYEEDFNAEDSDRLSESVSVGRTNVHRADNSVTGGGYSRRTDSKPNTVHLKTSGSANGEDSADAPRFAREEPVSSVASTVNVSQINVAAQKPNNSLQRVVKPSADSNFPLSTRINNSDNQPTLRLTNKNTNAIFELRLPEHLANLNSTITYNSASSNDEIKLSIGCQAQQANSLNQQSAVQGNSQNCSHDNRHEPKHNSPQLESTTSLDVEHCTVIENAAKATVARFSRPIHVHHKGTQFPTDEIDVIGSISTNLMNLFETRMVEIVEGNKLHWNRGSCKDISVQVAIDNGEAAIRRHPSVERTSTSSHANVAVTPGTDSYDSHAKNLERPSGSLVFSRQMENEIERTLCQNRTGPVQMESSFSSISVPTSLSELPFKSGSTSSSDLAFPLDRKFSKTSFDPNQLSRLHPAPIFAVDQEAFPPPDSASDNSQEELVVNHEILNSPDVSAHLHPRPEVILGSQTETEALPAPNGSIDVAESGNENGVILQDAPKIEHLVLDIQPYDSDLMSEGEVGYVYTSNSYSSGEIVERKKTLACNRQDGVDASSENKNEIAYKQDVCFNAATGEQEGFGVELLHIGLSDDLEQQKNFSGEETSDSTTTSETC